MLVQLTLTILFYLFLPIKTTITNSFQVSLDTPANNHLLLNSFFPKWGYEKLDVINLNLDDESQRPTCLNILTNFVNVQLNGIYQLVVLLRPIPVIYSSTTSNISLIKLIWMQKVKRKMSYSSRFIHSCNYASGFGSGYSVFCNPINVTNFIKLSKPWTCELEIDLFPPFLKSSEANKTLSGIYGDGHIREIIKWFAYPIFWPGMLKDDKEIKKVIPSSRPKTKLLVISNQALNNWDKLESLIHDWITGSLQQKAENFHFFIATSTPSLLPGHYEITTFSQIIMPNSHKPITLHRICSNCKFYYEKLLVKSNNETILSIQHENPMDECGARILSQFFDCTTYFVTSRDPLNMIRKRWRYIDNGIAHIMVHLLGSVMKRYSYKIDLGYQSSSCKSGTPHKLPFHYKWILTKLYVNRESQGSQHHTPFFFRHTQNSLRFVMCGERGRKSLAYSELIGAYQHEVWIMLILSLFILQTVVNSFNDRINLDMLSLLKALVEQSNPFRHTLWNENTRICLILIVYLLTAIIISNGYKSKNIYNMVKGLEVIKYERVEQLVHDKVEIFTTMHILRMHFISILNIENASFSDFSSNHTVNFTVDVENKGGKRDTFFLAISQVSRLITKYSYPLYSVKGANEILNFLYNNSILLDPSRTLKLLSKFASELGGEILGLIFMEIFDGEDDHFVQDYRGGLYLLLQKLELDELFQEFRKCKNKALIIRSLEAEQFAMNLGREGKLAYVGKEIYSWPTYAFHFEGLVPTKFVKKMAAFKETGILDHLMEVLKVMSLAKHVESDNAIKSDENEVKGASMNGNVIVVFSILFVGWACSIFVYGAESKIACAK